MPLDNRTRSTAKTLEIKAASLPTDLVEPVVVSFSRNYRAAVDGLTAGEVGAKLSDVLTEVSASIREAGGFIGHVKGILSLPEGGALGISVVRDRADWKNAAFDGQSPLSTFKVSITAIVYDCCKEELNRLLRLGLALGLPKNLYEEVVEKPAASVVSINSILASRPSVVRTN